MSELNSNRVAAIGVMTTAARTSMPRRRSIVHGIPGIARSRSKLNGLFWSVSFLAFTRVMIYFVVQSIRNYFQYPHANVGVDRDRSAGSVSRRDHLQLFALPVRSCPGATDELQQRSQHYGSDEVTPTVIECAS